MLGKTPENNDSLTNAKVVIPLKHLTNFCRSLDIPLINCEVELILIWSNNCVLADMAVDANADPAIVAPSGATFKIADTKLYVPVVTLSNENDTKPLEQLKLGFRKTIKWNKYRSQITVQPQNNNLNYLIDSIFANVNRLFVLSFQGQTYDEIMDDKNNYRLIAIDLSKQNKLKDLQQVSFIGKRLNTHGATMFFIIEKSEETVSSFSQNSVTII